MDTASLSVAGHMGRMSAPPDFTLTLASAAAKRLLWTLNSPLESAIQVAPDQYYEPGDVMEPYFRPATADLAASWHAVSQESLMEPQVAAMTVRIGCVDSWKQFWDELHRDCPNADDHQRPAAKHIQLEVTASGSFFTIHEYVSAVHPWLMGMRETLLDPLGKLQLGPPWPPKASLVVLSFGPRPLRIDHERKWAEWYKKPTIVRPSQAEKEEAARKVWERVRARFAAARAREV